MSRFTEGAKYSQYSVHCPKDDNNDIKRIRDKFNFVSGKDDSGKGFVSNQNIDIETRLEGKGMSGVLAVKDLDLGASEHCLLTRPDDPHTHVEPKLLTGAGASFGAKGLTRAKVIIYLEHSPCRQCTGQLLELCRRCASAIVGNTANCYFVFNFQQYYTKARCSQIAKQALAWNDEAEAKQAYKTLTTNGGKVNIDQSTYNFINFRQVGVDQYGKLKLAPAPSPVIVPSKVPLPSGNVWNQPPVIMPGATAPVPPHCNRQGVAPVVKAQPGGSRPVANTWTKPLNSTKR